LTWNKLEAEDPDAGLPGMKPRTGDVKIEDFV